MYSRLRAVSQSKKCCERFVDRSISREINRRRLCGSMFHSQNRIIVGLCLLGENNGQGSRELYCYLRYKKWGRRYCVTVLWFSLVCTWSGPPDVGYKPYIFFSTLWLPVPDRNVPQTGCLPSFNISLTFNFPLDTRFISIIHTDCLWVRFLDTPVSYMYLLL